MDSRVVPICFVWTSLDLLFLSLPVSQVLVNGIDHKPTYGSPNKKHAKATAATVALQALGLAPKELLANTTTFRSASQT